MKVDLPSPALAFGTLCLVSLMVLLSFGGEPLVEVLRYDRIELLNGEMWRLISGHFVHLNLMHLIWNLLGLTLIAGLFSPSYQGQDWFVIFSVSALTIVSAFLLFEPDLVWYVGFSGILHGLFAAGILAWLRTSKDPLIVIAAVLFTVKLLLEYLFGALPFLQEQFSAQIVHSAHFYGAIGGLVAALGAQPNK
jgi:rhomboid family GlyGly-CTERM serine protease